MRYTAEGLLEPGMTRALYNPDAVGNAARLIDTHAGYNPTMERTRTVYHVSTPDVSKLSAEGGLLKVGDVLDRRDGVNRFWSRLLQGQAQGSEVAVNALIRETFWEQIREEVKPDLPSRQQCLFAAPTPEAAEGWIPALASERIVYLRRCVDALLPPLSTPDTAGLRSELMRLIEMVRIVELEAVGRIHRCDSSLLTDDQTLMEQNARLYWAGEGHHDEVLIVGTATVTGVVANIRGVTSGE